MKAEKEKTYLEKRVFEQMGLTKEQCSLKLTGTFLPSSGKVIPIFTSDEHDNIDILVYDLKRRIIEYIPDETELTSSQLRSGQDIEAYTKQYIVKRFNPEYLKANPEQPKYKFPGGKKTYPFFPPKLIEKYEKAVAGDPSGKIDTLVLTEGYFKAMCASERGLDIIGLGSITLFADKQTRQLYQDITRLIIACQPNNIIILYDGDCTDLSAKAIQEMERGGKPDLATRPQGFHAALTKLRDLLLEFKNDKGEYCELFFAYVKKLRTENPAKGIDDLFCDPEYKEDTKDITEDLQKPGRPGIYFEKVNLRTKSNSLRDIFGIWSPERFYDRWKDIIGDRTFRFKGGEYRWDRMENRLITELSEQLKDFICVANTIYYRCKVPSVYSDEGTYNLLPKERGIVNDKFGKDSAANIIRHRYFQDFTNIPSHTDYRQEINSFYNIYKELSYTPSEGSWGHIKATLTHLFHGEDSEEYKLVLDYLQIMYTKPTQPLPVLALVSEEHGTGKTSFLNLIGHIFEDNSVIGDNNMLLSQFNSVLAGKIAVCIDETQLQDNSNVANNIKRYVTSEYILMEQKGRDKVRVPNFMKMIMTSNYPEKFVYPDKDENRYWIVKVGSLSEEEQKVNVNDYFADEVPHFVYYLLHRELHVKEREGRLWFAPKRYINENFKRMLDRNMPKAEKTIRIFLHDMFLDCQRELLELDVRYFQENIPEFQRREDADVRNIIEYNLKIPRYAGGAPKRVKMPFRSTLIDNEGEICWSKGRTCRPYTFKAEDFLESWELDALRNHGITDNVEFDTQTEIVLSDNDKPF